MPNYAEIVSTLALGVSAASLGWHVVRDRRDHPAVKVDLGVNFELQSDHSGGYSLRVTVRNSGGRAITIAEVDWQHSANPDWRMALTASNDFVRGPSLPHRLDSYDSAMWLYAGTLVDGIFGKTDPVQAVVTYQTRRRRAGWLGRWDDGRQQALSRSIVISEETSFPPRPTLGS